MRSWDGGGKGERGAGMYGNVRMARGFCIGNYIALVFVFVFGLIYPGTTTTVQ